MGETEQQREERASELAYAKGRRDAEVDARLNGHEARLNAINGSIERAARRSSELAKGIEGLGDKIDGVIGTLATGAAVEAERVAQVKRANEKQISGRTFWLGVAAIVVAIIIGVATILANAHGGAG